jgi:hypothetical protein
MQRGKGDAFMMLLYRMYRESRACGAQMQATIECVSRYVWKQMDRPGMTQPQSYSIYAHFIPSYYLERIVSTRMRTEASRLVRVPIVEKSSTVRARPPQKVCIPHGCAPLLLYTA